MKNKNIFAVACIITGLLLLLPTYANTTNTSTTTVHQLNDLVTIEVNSNTNIQEYQIVISTGNGTIDAYLLDGFMENSTKLSVPEKTVFFNLKTSGNNGDITLVFSGCITIQRVNMLTDSGTKIVNIGLPTTICEY